jgi:hypothetical protein
MMQPSAQGKLRRIRLNRLVLDNDGQRGRAPKPKAQVIRMARDWDWDLYQPLKVSARPDGSYNLLDGRLRAEAAIKHGLKTVLCEVVRGLSPDDGP